MEIVVTGRNVEVPDHFREHIGDKVARLERYDGKIVALEVELFHERNRRQMKSCQRVEITGRGGSGAVARAEACAQDFYAALDAAVAKLEARLRRSHDRRRVTARRSRVLVGRGSATAVLDDPITEEFSAIEDAPAIPAPRSAVDDTDEDLLPGRIVRRKAHTADPMSVEDALERMELVGHDFYLFSDADSGAPSVVYRRRGYDYGVLRLAD